MKTILKIITLIAILGAMAGLTYLVLYLCGFTSVESFAELKNTLGDSLEFWLIIVLLQIVQVVFIPISNQIISVPIALLFNDELVKVFLASWIGISIGTIILYFIGRFGGKKILNWLLSDKEKVERCTNFLQKSKAFYVPAMLIPFLPDDIITTLAGASGYSALYVVPSAIITRGICVACSVWGFGYLTKYWWGWLVLIVGIVAMLGITFVIYKKMNKNTKNL